MARKEHQCLGLVAETIVRIRELSLAAVAVDMLACVLRCEGGCGAWYCFLGELCCHDLPSLLVVPLCSYSNGGERQVLNGK